MSVEQLQPVDGSNPRPDTPLVFVVRRQDLAQFGYTTGCTGSGLTWPAAIFMSRAHEDCSGPGARRGGRVA